MSGAVPGVVTAGSGQPWESDLVTSLERPGAPMTVVRRCADIGEVLATAATGRARIAVVDGSLRRLDTEAVQRLRSAGVTVVGVFASGDTRSRARLERLGVEALVGDTDGADAVLAVARQAVADRRAVEPPPGVAADPVSALPPTGTQPPAADQPPDDLTGPPGRLVAVWGPTGAPGRSTVAAGLADALAAQGTEALLIDGDVYGGVLASAFGVLEESPGLAGACRAAANGRLGPADLDRFCWAVGPRLRLLTGIARSDRWPEIRPSSLAPLLTAARQLATVTVADCGFAIEADEELSFDTLAPRRNGATLTLLDAADRVLVVGSADPPGMERLVRALSDLRETLPGVTPEVVLNRVRSSVGPAADALAALRRFTGIEEATVLPDDRAATDAAWARGLGLSEAAPKSELRTRLAALARTSELVGA
ncbi:AAA family ATPase [Nakamurella deserti]|uniref:AAA family ATPase n=1 Tax=Nakamurella deserti TaxID=2164074 RepID=UPI000DBE88C9|nr:chromosome partitioning protein [Nakamurella deserti]